AAARDNLEQALKLAAEALSLAPNDLTAASLRQALAADLATLDGTYQLSGLRLITNFAGAGPTAPLLHLAVSSGTAYILGQDGRLLRYPLEASSSNASATKALDTQPPSANGEGALAPIPPEEGSGAFYLDGERRLFRYSGQTAKAVSLRGADDWLSFQAIAFREGSLYVLDSRASQVWRYLPTEGGYDSERRSILKGAQLTAATDLAIAGDVYILEAGGRVRRFVDGRESTFPQSGLTQPLVNPRRIMVGRRSQRVYVVDSGQRRIVVFSPDGAFFRQFTDDTLDSLQDAAIDEAGSKVYLVTQSGLYEANLPP
ncbi:MAG: hypothetical protein HY677_01895, partial [Chloroflexi bacterium]|nr:hypothetical protein [Chloroflexota bacterium]